MNRLADELLSRIFVECLPQGAYLRPDPREAPLLFTLVSRRWREAALRTPQLWSSLSTLPLCYDGVELQGTRSAPLTESATWLSRSGQCPLSLEHSFEASDPSLGEWAQVICSHLTHLQRLRAVCGFEMDLGQLLESTHCLRFLTLQGLLDGGAQLSTVRPHRLMVLHTLVIDCIHRPHSFLCSVDCFNLSSLALRMPPDAIFNQDEFLSVVDHCPRLENFVCSRITINSTQFHPRTHLKIRSLAISFHYAVFGDFPVLLCLPNLVNLRLTSRFNDLEEELDGEEGDPLSSRLRSIWVDMSEEDGIRLLDLGWTSLTHIEAFIRGDVTGVVRTLLVLSTALEALIVHGKIVETRETLAPFDEPLKHTLTSLEISMPSMLANVLNSLSFPRLRSLRVGCACHGDWSAIQAFLTRTDSDLNMVVLTGTRDFVRWAKEGLEQLAASMPHVESFRIKNF